MAQRDATPAQLAKLKAIRKEFPSARKRGYRVDPASGTMRIEVVCAAGVWHWWFDRDGRMVNKALHEALPDVVPEPEPESAFIAWANTHPVEGA